MVSINIIFRVSVDVRVIVTLAAFSGKLNVSSGVWCSSVCPSVCPAGILTVTHRATRPSYISARQWEGPTYFLLLVTC